VDAPADAAVSAAMAVALAEARSAGESGEVPVGAVVLVEGRIVARAGNERERRGDPTAHAEVLALRAAAEVQGTWRLDGATLVVTLEPCPMCAGAIVHARVGRVVFAATDPRTGAAGSVYNILQSNELNHRCEVTGGMLAEESGGLLRDFFRSRR
jgi:tRNA(adenine34) deaminase